MNYKYKKGKTIKSEESIYSYTLSTKTISPFYGGLSKDVFETDNINDYIKFCINENAKRIILIDINQVDLDLVLSSLSSLIEEIEIYQSIDTKALHFEKLEKCENVKSIVINLSRKKLSLWKVEANLSLEKLEINGVNRLEKQDNLINAKVKELIIRSRVSNMNTTSTPIIEDFSIFNSMPNLRLLELFIGSKSDKEKDLISLSNLINLERITLPKTYFTFNQFAWLSSKLPNTLGIGCIKEERWNKRIEKMEYTINGIKMPWEYKDYYGDGINKYLEKFDALKNKYKNKDIPPLD